MPEAIRALRCMKCPECEGNLIMVYHDEEEELTDIQCVVCGYLSKTPSDFIVEEEEE